MKQVVFGERNIKEDNRMKTSTATTDNVSEILNKVIEFADYRGRILTKNITNVHTADFTPKDLDAKGFADLMAGALSEHLINDRILLIDNDNFKFGANGSFQAAAIIDEQALELKESDTKQYLHLQLKKLTESRLNKKIASQLLSQKQLNYSKLNT
jgi:hypothetical protein